MTNEKAQELARQGYVLEQHFTKRTSVEVFALYKGDDTRSVSSTVFEHLKESFPNYKVHTDESPKAICKTFIMTPAHLYSSVNYQQPERVPERGQICVTPKGYNVTFSFLHSRGLQWYARVEEGGDWLLSDLKF